MAEVGQSRAVNFLLQELRSSRIDDPIANSIRLCLQLLPIYAPELGATAGTGAWNGSTTSIRAATSSSDLRKLAVALNDKYHRKLPDALVALGLSEEAAKESERAAIAYHEALDLGLPILQRFTDILWDGVRRLGISENLTALSEAVNRKIPGILWSAWRQKDRLT